MLPEFYSKGETPPMLSKYKGSWNEREGEYSISELKDFMFPIITKILLLIITNYMAIF